MLFVSLFIKNKKRSKLMNMFRFWIDSATFCFLQKCNMKLMSIVVVGDIPNPYNHLFNKYSSRGSHKPAIVLHLGDKGGSKIENISFHGELQDNTSYVSGCSRGRCNREEEEQ